MTEKNAQKTSEKAQPNAAQAPATPAFAVPKAAVKVQAAKLFYWFPYVRTDGQPAIQQADIEKGRANNLHCEVLLRKERHDSPKLNAKTGVMEHQFFYLVKLLQAAKAVDRDKTVHDMPVGEVVVVDERHQLHTLVRFLDTQKTVEAVIMPQGKISGGQGNVLLFDILAVPTERTPLRLPAETVSAAAAEAAATAAPMDDIPFN